MIMSGPTLKHYPPQLSQGAESSSVLPQYLSQVFHVTLRGVGNKDEHLGWRQSPMPIAQRQNVSIRSMGWTQWARYLVLLLLSNRIPERPYYLIIIDLFILCFTYFYIALYLFNLWIQLHYPFYLSFKWKLPFIAIFLLSILSTSLSC